MTTSRSTTSDRVWPWPITSTRVRGILNGTEKRRRDLDIFVLINQSRFMAFTTYHLLKSTCSEWSTIRSVGHLGLTTLGSTPCLARASLIAARSTIAGMPLCKRGALLLRHINTKEREIANAGNDWSWLTWSPVVKPVLGRRRPQPHFVSSPS